MIRGGGGNPYFRDLSRPPPGYSTHQHLNHRDHHPRHQLQRRNQNQFDQRNYHHQSQFSQDGDHRNFERQSYRGTDERRHEDLRRQGSGGRRDDPRGKPSRWDRQDGSSTSRNNSIGREGCDYRGKNNSNDRNGSSSTFPFPAYQDVANTKKKPSETVTSHSSSSASVATSPESSSFNAKQPFSSLPKPVPGAIKPQESPADEPRPRLSPTSSSKSKKTGETVSKLNRLRNKCQKMDPTLINSKRSVNQEKNKPPSSAASTRPSSTSPPAKKQKVQSPKKSSKDLASVSRGKLGDSSDTRFEPYHTTRLILNRNHIFSENKTIDVANFESFKTDLKKLTPSVFNELINDPKSVKASSRKNIQKLVNKHKYQVSNMIDEAAFKQLVGHGCCDDNKESPQDITINFDASQDHTLMILSQLIKQSDHDLDMSGISDDEAETVSPVAGDEDGEHIVVVCDPPGIKTEPEDDDSPEEPAVARHHLPASLNLPGLTITTLESSQLNSAPRPASTERFAPPEQKRKRGRPRKGEERKIGETDTILGSLLDDMNVSLDDDGAGCPIDGDSHTGDIRDCLRDATVEIGNNNYEQNIHHFLDDDHPDNLVANVNYYSSHGSYDNNISNGGKAGPRKCEVDDACVKILTDKIKSMKQIFKVESR